MPSVLEDSVVPVCKECIALFVGFLVEAELFELVNLRFVGQAVLAVCVVVLC